MRQIGSALVLCFLAALSAASAAAQGGGATAIRSGSSLPAVCTPAAGPQGNFFYLTIAAVGNPQGLYFCLAANVWVPLRNLTEDLANETVTGTTVNKLVKLTGAPSTAIITSTGDTGGITGIVYAGAGKTGNATIALAGLVACVFDAGGTTAGHYVQNSTTTNGDCGDAGATYPTAGEVLGIVLSTNAGAGTYNMILFSPEIRAAAATIYTGTTPIVVSGTTISCPTCNVGLVNGPPPGAVGGLIGSGVLGAAVTGGFWTKSQTSNLGNNWPVAGWFRGHTTYTSAVNAAPGQNTGNFYTNGTAIPSSNSFVAISLYPWDPVGSKTAAANQFYVYVGDRVSEEYTNIANAPTVPGQTLEFVPNDATATNAGSNVVGDYLANQTIPASTTQFFSLFCGVTGADNSQTTSPKADMVIPFAATWGNFMFSDGNGVQPAVGALTLNVNQNDSASTSTITVPTSHGANLPLADFTHTVSFAAGDVFSFSGTQGITNASSAIISLSGTLKPTSGTASLVGACVQAAIGTGVTTYDSPFMLNTSTTQASQAVPLARSGTFKNLYAYISTAATGTSSMTITLEKAPGPSCTVWADTTLTGTFTTGSGVKALDTTHSVAMSQGDCINIKRVQTNAGGATISTISMEFD